MPQASWQLLTDAIGAERDPRRRHNLQIVAEHVVHEVAGDIPALMSTLAPDPVYHFWGPTGTPPARGEAAVEAHYRSLTETGKNRLEFRISRVVVDHAHVVTEGEFRFAYQGADVLALPSAPDVADSGAWYLVATHCLILWPIDENGLIRGEEVYAGEPARVLRRLAPGELPHLGPVSRN